MAKNSAQAQTEKPEAQKGGATKMPIFATMASSRFPCGAAVRCSISSARSIRLYRVGGGAGLRERS